jgi:Protein of unknown function (DUF2975)
VKANLKYLFARCAVIGLFAIVTMLQIFSFPGQFAHMRRVQSIDLVVEILLTTLVGVWMLLGQIGLVALWKLLRFAQEKQFFSPSAVRWLKLLCRVAKGAAGVPALLFLVIAPRADDPGILVMLTAVTLFLVTIAIFLAILKEQISMKSEERVG